MDYTSAGIDRLRLELGSAPRLSECERKYNELVDRLANCPQKGSSGDDFLKFAANNFPGTLSENGPDLLWECVESNTFDCDAAAFLILDAANKIGLNVKIVLVAKHIFVKAETLFIDPTVQLSFQISDNKFIPQLYPVIYAELSGLETIRAISIKVMADANDEVVSSKQPNIFSFILVNWLNYNRVDFVIKAYSDVIEKIPTYANAYMCRGNRFMFLGDFDSALKDYNEAIRQDPYYSEAYYNRFRVYHERPKKEIVKFGSNQKLNKEYYASAICDLELAIKFEKNAAGKAAMQSKLAELKHLSPLYSQ